MAGKITLFGLLKQHVVLGSELAREIRAVERGSGFSGDGSTALFFSLFDLVGHGRGRRALAAGVGEDVDGGKLAGLQEGNGLRKFLLCLAGEADNEIGRDRTAGKVAVQEADTLKIPCGIIFAVHAL